MTEDGPFPTFYFHSLRYYRRIRREREDEVGQWRLLLSLLYIAVGNLPLLPTTDPRRKTLVTTNRDYGPEVPPIPGDVETLSRRVRGPFIEEKILSSIWAPECLEILKVVLWRAMNSLQRKLEEYSVCVLVYVSL